MPTFVGELGTDVLPLPLLPGVGGTIDLSVSGALGFLNRYADGGSPMRREMPHGISIPERVAHRT